MNYKIAMIDLDGTLLDGRTKINKKNLESLKEYNKKGGEIIIATGRWPISAFLFNKTIEKFSNHSNKYIATLNGALIYDLEKSVAIYDKPINPNVSKQIIANAFTKLKTPMLIYSKEGINSKIIHSYNFPLKWLISKFNCGKIINHDGSDITIYKLFLFNISSKKIDRIYKWLKENFNEDLHIIRTSKIVIEVTHKEVGKGKALEFLSNTMKVEMKNFVTFGDSGNDVEMFKKSGFRIALNSKNNKLVDESNIVLNHKNGVKNGIEKYILNPKLFSKSKNLIIDFSKGFFNQIEKSYFIKNINFWNYLIQEKPLVLITKYSLEDNLLMFKEIINLNKNILIYNNSGRSIYSCHSKKVTQKVLISELQIVLLKDFLVDSLKDKNIYIIISKLNGKNLFLTSNPDNFVHFISNSNFNEDNFNVVVSDFENYFNAKKVEYLSISIIGLSTIPKSIKVDSLEIITNGMVTTISNKQTLLNDLEKYSTKFFGTKENKLIEINKILESNNKVFDTIDSIIHDDF